MSKYAFGVDIGGTTVKLGFFDKEGNILDKWEIPTILDNEGAAILPDIVKSIRGKMESIWYPFAAMPRQTIPSC